MFRHYRKLQRYGYENYLPINQLDVRTLADPIWEQAARTGYPAYATSQAVALTMLEGGEQRFLSGTATAVSDGEVSVRLLSPSVGDIEFVQAFQRKKQRFVQLLFLASGEIRLAEMFSVTSRIKPDITVLRLSLVDLESIESLVPERQQIPTVQLQLRIGDDRRRLMGTTAQQLVAAFQLLEAARIIEAEVLRDADPGGHWRVDPPELQHMTADSPLEILLAVAGGVGSIVTASLMWAKGYYEVHKSRLGAIEQAFKVEAAKHDVDRSRGQAQATTATAEQEELKVELLRLELTKRRAITLPQAQELQSAVLPAVGVDIGRTIVAEELDPATRETILRLVERQLGPAAQRLVRHAGGSISITAESG